jgi:hypothetical protein
MLRVYSAILILLIMLTGLESSADPVDEISRLKECISQEKDSPEKVECYLLLSQYYRQIDKDSSLLFCDLAYRLSEKTGYATGIADALYKKSLTLTAKGNYNKSLLYAHRFLSVADSLHDSLRLAKAYYNLANLKYSSAYKRSALSYFNNALSIFSRMQDSSAMLAIYNGLGNYFQAVAEYDSAAYYYHKAIRFCKFLGQEAPLGRIIGNLGTVSFTPRETLPLNPGGITWLSFPRLERDENGNMPAADALTGRIETELVEEDRGNMEGKNKVQDASIYIDWVWDPFQGSGTWEPRAQAKLDSVNSTRGYILDLGYQNPPQQNSLELSGDLLSMDASIDQLYAGRDNWTGYWLLQEQFPLDAFEHVLDKLEYIKGQNWFCTFVLYTYTPDGPPQPPGSPAVLGCWKCEQGARLKYGDMVKVKPKEDIYNFRYSRPGKAATGTQAPPLQHFSYVEQTSYVGLVVELDSGQNPREIGAFVGDTCIGASVVPSGDSICMIKAYTQAAIGNISFELYYGDEKSARARIHEYLVLNTRSMQREIRSIHTGEQQGVFFISLKQQPDDEPAHSGASLQCHPNPLDGVCSIRVYNPRDTEVKLELTDMYGKTLGIIEEGRRPKGAFLVRWDTARWGLTPGMYFIRLSSPHYSITQKIIYAR